MYLLTQALLLLVLLVLVVTTLLAMELNKELALYSILFQKQNSIFSIVLLVIRVVHTALRQNIWYILFIATGAGWNYT